MYGANAGKLRVELAILLRQHRIQQRLGGPGLHSVPETTTLDERQAFGEQIGRYRHSVLVWCLQAVRAGNPRINLEQITGRGDGPAETLQSRLEAAVASSTAGLPPLDELTAEQAFPMVETWRQAARSAALGEHDFDTVGYGLLTDSQCKTVLKDAAEVARALVALDRRYSNIPGWQSLTAQGRLGRAAEVCAVFAGNEDPDYTVDLRGWRPAPATTDEHALPGVTGVLQAQHTLLVHLGTFPDARSLRLVLDSQRIMSRTAAVHLEPHDPESAGQWRVREQAYQRLIRGTRDLGGGLGNGGLAAGQAALVAARVHRLKPAEFASPAPLKQLEQLCDRVDQRIGQIVEHGALKRLYFLRVPLPRVDASAAGLVKPIRERYVPLTWSVGPDLIAMVRADLRPASVKPSPPPGAAASRADFTAAIVHRPNTRGSPGALSV